MTSDELARDCLRRARARRRALDTLLIEGDYADVVRESQDTVELILKGALRFVGVDPPKRHDVADIVREFLARFPGAWRQALRDMEGTLAMLGRERSRAFYGDEGQLSPASDLFEAGDARRAIAVVDRLLELFAQLLERP